MEKGFKITFAVVPMITDVLGNCPDTQGNIEPRWIGDNKMLVNWLKEKVAQGVCEIAMHGINHQYKTIGEKRLSEMMWRDSKDTENMLKHYKEKMEELFETDIKWFVAPHNDISHFCINAAIGTGMQYSGIIPITYQRDFTLRNTLCYLKRWCIRLVAGVPYPGILYYSDHIEINACALGSETYLRKIFHYCCNHNLPMVINTHYWSLRDKVAARNRLNQFLTECKMNREIIPCTLKDFLRNKENE